MAKRKRRRKPFTRSIKRKTAQTKRKTVSTRRKTSGTQHAAKTASRATPTRRKSPKATSRFSPEAFLSGHKRELIGVTLMALGALTVVAALSSGERCACRQRRSVLRWWRGWATPKC